MFVYDVACLLPKQKVSTFRQLFSINFVHVVLTLIKVSVKCDKCNALKEQPLLQAPLPKGVYKFALTADMFAFTHQMYHVNEKRCFLANFNNKTWDIVPSCISIISFTQKYANYCGPARQAIGIMTSTSWLHGKVYKLQEKKGNYIIHGMVSNIKGYMYMEDMPNSWGEHGLN